MDDVKICINRLLLAAALLFLASHSSSALAVDCKVALSKIDKIICSNYGLAGQDTKLNEDYGDAMNRLSPEGQSVLRADQINWLRYRAQACGFADGNKELGDMRCLIRQLDRRDRSLLSNSHQQMPPLYV